MPSVTMDFRKASMVLYPIKVIKLFVKARLLNYYILLLFMLWKAINQAFMKRRSLKNYII